VSHAHDCRLSVSCSRQLAFWCSYGYNLDCLWTTCLLLFIFFALCACSWTLDWRCSPGFVSATLLAVFPLTICRSPTVCAPSLWYRLVSVLRKRNVAKRLATHKTTSPSTVVRSGFLSHASWVGPGREGCALSRCVLVLNVQCVDCVDRRCTLSVEGGENEVFESFFQ
jgi:hypothetical protein